jgi:two-component system, cell cycle response regulator
MSKVDDPCDGALTLAIPQDATESGAYRIPNAFESSPRRTPMLPARPLSIGAPRATLTIMSGMDAGRIIALEGEAVVIGREVAEGLTIEDPGLSRQHARITRNPDGTHRIEDLSSTNGTLVRGVRVAVAPLEHGDYVQLGGSLLVRFAMIDPAEEALGRQLYESSVQDPLTRVYNRRYFVSRLDAEVACARRSGEALALLMLDVDRFKRFNDAFGHLPGDRALCFIAAKVLRQIRAGSVLARYGGEEFAVLAPGTASMEAGRLAERVRGAIEGLRFSAAATTVSLTVSIGVATVAELGAHEGGPALIAMAEARLLAAKASGRNRVHGT